MGKKEKRKSLDANSSLNDSTTTPSAVKLEAIDHDISQTEEAEDYESLCKYVNAIAKPLANRKLAKKIFKLIKKASGHKTFVRQGIADVQRALRKNETGLMILAGDVNPIEIYAHLPAVCEEKDIPYVFTPCRRQLGLAAGHKRAAIVMLIRDNEEYKKYYDECDKLMRQLPLPINN